MFMNPQLYFKMFADEEGEAQEGFEGEVHHITPGDKKEFEAMKAEMARMGYQL